MKAKDLKQMLNDVGDEVVVAIDCGDRWVYADSVTLETSMVFAKILPNQQEPRVVQKIILGGSRCIHKTI